MPRTLVFVIIATAASVITSPAEAQSNTAFTYQGQLSDAGASADGDFDMIFTLYDAESGGALVGSTQFCGTEPITVTGGLFTAELDFGSDAFDGQSLWLEVRVRPAAGTCQGCGGACPYTTLAPRQPITAAPYAIHTRGIQVNADESFTGIGRSTPVTPAEVFGLYKDTDDWCGMYIETSGQDGRPFYGYSAGGDVDAYHWVDGTTGAWSLVNGGVTRMTVTAAGNVGVGTITPSRTLDVAGVATADGFEVTHTNGHPSQVFASSDLLWMANYAAGNIVFGTTTVPGGAATGRMAIKDDGDVEIYGRVDIGTPSGAAKLNSDGGGLHGAYLTSDQTGVWGATNSSSAGRYGVFGQHPSGSSYGVYASGRMGASGTKSFRIDHPLEPENKYLAHYCAEAPEPLNVYSGTVALDDRGEAWVDLPDYFQEINRDPRYQLTCIGGYANVYIAREAEDNRFQIAGGRPGLKVSWEVKGVRNDLWVRSNGAPVEMQKPAELQGRYLHPELYGLSQEYAEHAHNLAVQDDTEPHEPLSEASVAPIDRRDPVHNASNTREPRSNLK